MSEDRFDALIVGAGPGGYVAAIRAAQLGFRTAIVEEKHLGGVCLNWGCIPTKALLRTSEIFRLIGNASAYGLKAGKPSFNLKAVVKRSRDVSKRLNAGVGHLLKKNGVTVIDGRAALTERGRVSVSRDGEETGAYRADHIVVATGARPRALPGMEPDGKLVWTYFEALAPDVMPASLLVVGSGAIGVEFASFYADMGADVTVVEIVDRILPAEDGEIAAIVRERLQKAGLKFITGARVTGVEKAANSVTATIEEAGGAERKLTVDRIVSAAGVVGNVEDLGLEAVGVATDRGCIVVDEYGGTDAPGVYAIGDVAGPPMLAHKAEHEGVVCMERIAGVEDVRPVNKGNIPGCTYCHPQVASVGLTEDAAREAGFDLRVGRFPFAGNGKAIALGEDQGLVKTVFDAGTGQLLGAHMVGAEVTELIQGYAVAMTLETTEAELMHTVFPHPTLSETMHESVLAAHDRAIHI